MARDDAHQGDGPADKPRIDARGTTRWCHARSDGEHDRGDAGGAGIELAATDNGTGGQALRYELTQSCSAPETPRVTAAARSAWAAEIRSDAAVLSGVIAATGASQPPVLRAVIGIENDTGAAPAGKCVPRATPNRHAPSADPPTEAGDSSTLRTAPLAST